jgi:hypothetical protein
LYSVAQPWPVTPVDIRLKAIRLWQFEHEPEHNEGA